MANYLESFKVAMGCVRPHLQEVGMLQLSDESCQWYNL